MDKATTAERSRNIDLRAVHPALRSRTQRVRWTAEEMLEYAHGDRRASLPDQSELFAVRTIGNTAAQAVFEKDPDWIEHYCARLPADETRIVRSMLTGPRLP